MKKFFIALLTALLVFGIAQANSFFDEQSRIAGHIAQEHGFSLDNSNSTYMSSKYSYTTMYQLFFNNQYIIMIYGDENAQGYNLQLYNTKRQLLIETRHPLVAQLTLIIEGTHNGMGVFTVTIDECKTEKCKVKMDIYVKPVGISI